MLECVYERVARARLVSRVVVATDDERISAAAAGFGAEVAMTRPDHLTGTERVAEVAAREKAEIIVNVQGDEPLIDPAAIDLAIAPLLDGAPPPMATLKKQIVDASELDDPNVVKVVTDFQGNAIYFSRSLIPFPRDGAAGGRGAVASGARGAAAGVEADGGRPVAHYKHIGLYVYQRDFLLAYPKLRVGPLERAEKLEQLRALENGYPIRVVETTYEAIGVDTPGDLERVRAILEGVSNG